MNSRNAETVLFSLALSIEAKDPYTKGHCDRSLLTPTPWVTVLAFRRNNALHCVAPE